MNYSATLIGTKSIYETYNTKKDTETDYFITTFRNTVFLDEPDTLTKLIIRNEDMVLLDSEFYIPMMADKNRELTFRWKLSLEKHNEWMKT